MSAALRMPVIFFGHGPPMNTLARNRYTEAWRTLGRLVPRPKAILCVSASAAGARRCGTRTSSFGVARFPLVADPQDAHHVERGLEAVEREIAAAAAGDDELAPVGVDAPADLGMVLQDLDGTPDPLQRGRGRGRRVLEQMFDDAFEVAERCRRVDYLRHRTARGRLAARPRTLAPRYACTSAIA
jgi:hypothetical protein